MLRKESGTGKFIMGNETHWEKLYADTKHQSIWPWSDLVTLVMRHVLPQYSQTLEVLELGCGAGANIPFFQSLNANYFGVDISTTAIEQLHVRFPELKHSITTADFCRDLPFSGPFDLVVDRGSLTHNESESIRNCLESLKKRTHSNSMLVGIHWLSTESAHYNYGEPTVDPYCRTNFTSGRFAGVGIVHFASESHLRDILKEYEIISLQHVVIENREPSDYSKVAYWNFVARRH